MRSYHRGSNSSPIAAERLCCIWDHLVTVQNDHMSNSRVPTWLLAFVAPTDDNTWQTADPTSDAYKAITARLSRAGIWTILQARPPTRPWVSSRVAFGTRLENVQKALVNGRWPKNDENLPEYVELVDLRSRGSRKDVKWIKVSKEEDLEGIPLAKADAWSCDW